MVFVIVFVLATDRSFLCLEWRCSEEAVRHAWTYAQSHSACRIVRRSVGSRGRAREMVDREAGSKAHVGVLGEGKEPGNTCAPRFGLH